MTKRLAVVSDSVEVKPADKSRRAKKAAAAVETALAGLPGGVCALMEHALDATVMGFAVGELLWDYDGSLRRVAWHDPMRFSFRGNVFGEVSELEVLDTGGLILPVSRFVVWSYQSRYGNPYGESDLIAAYRPWSTKDSLLRMWGSALDKFGTPTIVGHVEDHATDEEKQELLGTLSALQSQSAIVVTKSTEVGLLEQQRIEPGAGFSTNVDFQNREIAKAILGQTLTTEQGSSGSYGLGKVHQDVLSEWISALRREMAAVVLTEQIAKPLSMMLAGADAPAPTVVLPILTSSEVAGRAELIIKLLTGQVIAPAEGWIRSYLGVPEPEAVIV